MYGAPQQPGQYGGPPQGVYDPNMGQQPMQPMQGVYDPNMGQQPMQPMAPQMMPMTQPMMGQPMGGMYDPQMMAMQQQDMEAQELADLEARQAFADEVAYQKAVDRMVHQLRSGNRNQDDNASCATTVCFWGIFNGLLWAVPLLGDNWWNKVWHGLGVRKLTMSLGLFNVATAVDCDGYAETNAQLCTAWTKYSHPMAITEMRDDMCKAVPGKCPVMQSVVQAGYIPLYGLPAAAACEVLSILLLYFYWHGKPSGLARNLGVRVASFAPVVGMLSVFSWLLWCPYMHELPRIWAEEGGNKDFANSSFFGMKESFTMPMGWCFIMVFIGVMSSTARFFVQWTMPFHIHEPDPLGLGDDGLENAIRRDAEKIIAQQTQMGMR